MDVYSDADSISDPDFDHESESDFESSNSELSYSSEDDVPLAQLRRRLAMMKSRERSQIWYGKTVGRPIHQILTLHLNLLLA